MLCFIFCQDCLSWLTTDILQLFPVMQILNAGDGKGHYSQSINTCLLRLLGLCGVQTGYGAVACHGNIWKMTFYQGHLQLWVWVSADSVQVNCPQCPYVLYCVCTAIQITILLSFSSRLCPVFLLLELHHVYTYSQTLHTERDGQMPLYIPVENIEKKLHILCYKNSV